MNPIEFTVMGLPKPAGSKRGFALKKGGVFTGRVAIADDCAKSRDWKITVSHEAAAAMVRQQAKLLEGPIKAHLTFYMPRPKGQIGRNGQPRKNAPARPVTKPDVLKLARAVEDAMTGIVYRDDSQIVIERLEKLYATMGPYCHILVGEARE